MRIIRFRVSEVWGFWGLGFRGLGCRVEGLGFEGFRVQGLVQSPDSGIWLYRV